MLSKKSQIGLGNSLCSICVYLSPEEKRSATRQARAARRTRFRCAHATTPFHLLCVCDKVPLETDQLINELILALGVGHHMRSMSLTFYSYLVSVKTKYS